MYIEKAKQGFVAELTSMSIKVAEVDKTRIKLAEMDIR